MNPANYGFYHEKTLLALFKLSGINGVDRDETGALNLLEERVRVNDAEAMWILGLCCQYAKGCKKNFERADSLYHQSADSGSEVGKFFVKNAGRLYRRGCGSSPSNAYEMFMSEGLQHLSSMNYKNCDLIVVVK